MRLHNHVYCICGASGKKKEGFLDRTLRGDDDGAGAVRASVLPARSELAMPAMKMPKNHSSEY